MTEPAHDQSIKGAIRKDEPIAEKLKQLFALLLIEKENMEIPML